MSAPVHGTLPDELTLLVVDDHPLIRDGLRGLVSTAVERLIVLEAGDLEEARRCLRERQPDVVIVDLVLPDGNGLDLVRQLRDDGFDAPILVLSMHAEDTHAERALRAGASGYVMKEEVGTTLLEALGRVLAGEVHLSPAVARRIAARVASPHDPEDSIATLLTDRELQVWRHLGSGCATRRIASLLGISPKTVETHCYNIRHKTGLPNMTALIHSATRWVHHGHRPGEPK